MSAVAGNSDIQRLVPKGRVRPLADGKPYYLNQGEVLTFMADSFFGKLIGDLTMGMSRRIRLSGLRPL